jgi:hypothetical protein
MANQDSITPSLNGQVWLKSVRHPFLNTVVRVSDYGDVENASRSAAFGIAGRSLPTAQTELHGGRDHPLDLVTSTPADSSHMELMLRTAEVLFVHVPATGIAGREGNLLLPGSMYVLVGTPRRHRIGGVSAHELFTLPLIEVNPPGADVVGGTLTWGTVMRLYGTWEAVLSAHLTWADLLAVVGDPEDLVVL